MLFCHISKLDQDSFNGSTKNVLKDVLSYLTKITIESRVIFLLYELLPVKLSLVVEIPPHLTQSQHFWDTYLLIHELVNIIRLESRFLGLSPLCPSRK